MTECACGPVETWLAGKVLCSDCGKQRHWLTSHTTARDLFTLPLTAWGRHELEAEVVRQRARIAELERCSACQGSKRAPHNLGACRWCSGTGRQTDQLTGITLHVHRLEKAVEEGKQKAENHRKQRDALQEKLAQVYKASSRDK